MLANEDKLNRDKINKWFYLVPIVLLVFLIGIFLPKTIELSVSNYESLEETFEILSELFSVFVALSIFAITWQAYDKSKDNHSFFLGITFLFTGLLILCHLLSYPFMPDFITPNSDEKSAIFFLESRFIMAFLLLASVYINNNLLPKLINKYSIVLITITIFVGFLSCLLFYQDLLFGGINLDGSSLEIVILLFIISIIFIAISYLYYKRAKETNQINLNYLANGSLIILVSNLVYFSYEFSGHFLIITGFFYIYFGLYKSAVELPYEKLAISEEKLRRSAEEKYHRLFDNANDAVVTIDTEGCVTSWNKSAEKLFGITAEEITGKRFVEKVGTPETMDEKEKMISKLASETITGQETACMRRDGTKIDVSVTISPLLDANRNIVEKSLILRDITEQKKSEEALRKSEEFSRTVLNSMNDSIMVINTYDLSILGANSFLLKKYGLKVEVVVGKKCFEVSHKLSEPCYYKNEICPLIESVKTGKYSTVEHVHFGKNGTKIYAEVSTSPIKDDTGKVVQIIHITRDITERKLAEMALKDSERRLKMAQQVAHLGNWEWNLITNDLYWAEENYRIHGIDPQKVKPSYDAFIQLVDPDEREFVKKTVTDALASKKSLDFDYTVIRPDNGEKRIINSKADVIVDSAGKSVKMVGTVQDITERKQVDKKIRRSLEEKEVLLREIHHRVKNNMQIISSLLMLQSQNIEDKKYKDVFIDSQNRINSMALIHEKLYQSENIAQINFKDYINDIISNIFESYCIKSNIKIDIKAESIPITIDYAVPCGLIINELVTNSLKYAFPGERSGKIEISIKSNNNNNNNNNIQLLISDDGIGIAKDLDIRNTKSLGLHLVTALVEGQLHGEIVLNREKGTEFQISFGAK